MTPTLPDAVAALTPVVESLEQRTVRYHIGGSLASSVFGAPRATADIDLVADLQDEDVDAIVSKLQAQYYVDRDQAHEATRDHRSFNLIHLATMLKIDVFVPERRPFEEQEFQRAQALSLEIGPNARAFFVKSPEDLVLRKLLWYRSGGEASERQWSDVIGIIRVQGDRLDRSYLTEWARQLQVDDLLGRAMTSAAML